MFEKVKQSLQQTQMWQVEPTRTFQNLSVEVSFQAPEDEVKESEEDVADDKDNTKDPPEDSSDPNNSSNNGDNLLDFMFFWISVLYIFIN